MPKTSTVVALAAALGSAAAIKTSLPYRVVFNQGIWLENINFDGKGNAFFSDAFAGIFYRIQPAPAPANFTVTPFITGLDTFGALGLSPSVDGSLMYFSGVSQGTNFLGAFNPTVPQKYSTVGTAANMTGGYLLNGLALDGPTGILYTTSLGHLQNGEGEILTTTIQHGGTLQVWKSGFSGSDGAFIDPRRRLFYVSELNSATVLVYNLDTGLLNNTYTAPGMTTLDDFGLDPSGTYLYGADLVGGRVVKFAANGTGPGFTVVDGLVNCTSVRFAKGPGFFPYSIFITEGGGQSPSENTRRVLEVNLSGSFEEVAEEW